MWDRSSIDSLRYFFNKTLHTVITIQPLNLDFTRRGVYRLSVTYRNLSRRVLYLLNYQDISLCFSCDTYHSLLSFVIARKVLLNKYQDTVIILFLFPPSRSRGRSDTAHHWDYGPEALATLHWQTTFQLLPWNISPSHYITRTQLTDQRR